VRENGKLQITVAGENLDGKFIRKTVLLPLGAAGSGEARLAGAGLETRIEGDKVYADNVVFGSAAQSVGIDFDWEIVHLEVEADRPAKQWMFIPALILLALVGLIQRRRHARQQRQDVPLSV
ncbi:MAG: DUF3394 domain-containing protein, partial [Anaerolineae bacterium]|nr:DUF3394 domain-containing protein [Anaerolineae bacterium]